jgi:hypothetical protein
MNFIFHEQKGEKIAELAAGDIDIKGVEEAVDILGNIDYLGVSKIISYKENFSDEFFDLKTCIAGDILQKFSNYRKKLAIVGDFSEIESKSLRDFIRESMRTGHILFVSTLDEALVRFSE